MQLKLYYAKKNNTKGFVFVNANSSPSEVVPGGVDFESLIGTYEITEASALVFVNVQSIIDEVTNKNFALRNPSFMTKSQIVAALQQSQYTHSLADTFPTVGQLTNAQYVPTGDEVVIFYGQTISGTNQVFKSQANGLTIIPAGEYADYIW